MEIAVLFGAAIIGTVCTAVGIGYFLATPTLETGILSGLSWYRTFAIIKSAWNLSLQ